MHRRPPVDVLEGQHLVLVVDHLSFHHPLRYLTEYAVSLVHARLPPTSFSRNSLAPPAPEPARPSRRSRCATGTARAAPERARPPRPNAALPRSTHPRAPRRRSPGRRSRPRGARGPVHCATRRLLVAPPAPPRGSPQGPPALARPYVGTGAPRPRPPGASARPSRRVASRAPARSAAVLFSSRLLRLPSRPRDPCVPLWAQPGTGRAR